MMTAVPFNHTSLANKFLIAFMMKLLACLDVITMPDQVMLHLA